MSAWAAQAEARITSVHGGAGVNVNVSFNSQLPLADTSDQAIAATQKRGRTFVYRMAIEECAVLKATIAESCRLTGINVSTRVRDPHNNAPMTLYLNGNARYVITLKGF